MSTNIKDMDIWVVGDSYAHGYRTAVKDYQLNKRVKKMQALNTTGVYC